MTSQKVLTVSVVRTAGGRLPGARLARGPQKELACVLLARGRLLLKCIRFDFLGWKWGCRNNARRWGSLWTRAMLWESDCGWGLNFEVPEILELLQP